jgi:flavin reductase (DIM6/NTAB) family NADH-FMN oxidoreductase RutF
MDIAPETLSIEATYKLLTGCVVPRPIAWVTTLADDGHINAAPFSAFTFVSNRPPMVGVSIGKKVGVLKDTPRNILARKEFVVNIGDLNLLDQLHLSAQEYPPDVSEVEELDIEVLPSVRIKTPRIAKAPVSLECRLNQVVSFNEKTGFYVGEIVNFHIRDGLLKNGKIETAELNPICRLGGPNYATLGDIITKKAIFVSSKDEG